MQAVGLVSGKDSGITTAIEFNQMVLKASLEVEAVVGVVNLRMVQLAVLVACVGRVVGSDQWLSSGEGSGSAGE